MSRRTDPKLQDRLSDAAQAKNALLAKFKQTLGPETAEATERRRQREAIAAARVERAALRETARQEQERERAKQAALAEEAIAKAARAAAEAEALELAAQAEREEALKAEQKMLRDQRYAARKAAKKARRKG